MVEGVFVTQMTRERLTLGADSGTVTVDMPTSNYLQGVRIRVQNTNGATTNNNPGGAPATVESGITRIEIVADGTVIYNMDGEMCRKFAQFDLKDLPPADERQNGAGVQYALFPIKFGRDDFDKDLLVPAHRFSTLQLRVTWAFTDSATVGWATSETNAIMDVATRYLVSNVRENTPFLKQIEVYRRSPTTTGTEDADLPVGSGVGAYRRLMFYVREAGVEPETNVDTYELLVNDSQRLIDERWTTSSAEDEIRYGVRTSKQLLWSSLNGESQNMRVVNVTALDVSPEGCCALPSARVVAGDNITMFLITPNTVSPVTVADQNIWLRIYGKGASNATMIDLGTDSLADSLNVSSGSGVSSLKLRYNQNNADSTNVIVTESVVRF